jgi:adenosylmethionine-8-amino-7-oxononanoate aminotransferase
MNNRIKGLIPGPQKDLSISTTKWDFGNIVDGKKIIDSLLGFGCYTLGFNRHDIIDYVCENLKTKRPEIAEDLSGVRENNMLNDVTFELTDELYWMTGGYKSFFALSGSDANEGAIKLASAYHDLKGNTHKKNIVSFKDSFHGSTFLTQGLSSSIIINPYYTLEKYSFVKNIDRTFDVNEIDWKNVSCIVVESRSWTNHLEEDSMDFWKKLDDIRNEYDVLIIIDDIFIGGGKSGHFFGWERLRQGINKKFRPDIFTMAKGITGGYFPLSITLYNQKIDAVLPKNFNWEHGFTYSFSLAGILSVIKVLKILKEENIYGTKTYVHNDQDDSKFNTNNRNAANIFKQNGFEINNQLGSMFSVKKNNNKYFYVIPLNATKEYFDILQEELKYVE